MVSDRRVAPTEGDLSFGRFPSQGTYPRLVLSKSEDCILFLLVGGQLHRTDWAASPHSFISPEEDL